MPTFKDFNLESGEERAEEVIYGQALENPPAWIISTGCSFGFELLPRVNSSIYFSNNPCLSSKLIFLPFT